MLMLKVQVNKATGRLEISINCALKSYPAPDRMSEMEAISIEQALAYFCGALKSIGDSWMTNDDWPTKFQYNAQDGMEQLVLKALECVIKAATERFDMMDEKDLKKDYRPQADAFDRISVESYSDKSSGCLSSPVTPTSVLPEVTSKSTQLRKFVSVVHAPSLLPLRVQALGKLNPIDVKRLSFSMFPHAVAQDSGTMIEQNKTAGEPKPETEVKGHSELMVTCTSEELKNCLAKNGTNMVQMSYLTEEKIGNAGNKAAALVQTPEDLAKEAAGDLLLPTLPPQLLPNAAAPPPSLPKLSLNVNVPAMTPPPPLPIPKLQQIITATIPSPPPPPPLSKMSTNVTAPSPPPPPMMPIRGSLPCPPPPPPMMPIKGSLPCPPPPPPIMPIKGSLPCPPPPLPMMPIKGSLPCPPPPLPMMPIKGSLPCPPPPLPMMPIKGSLPCPPPPMPPTNGGAPPPPPPVGAARSLRPKKATTKLKRSSHMGILYRVLRGKVEGSCLTGKSAQGQGRKSQTGSSSGGCQLGMADALAEMTKRSSYFLQIEEDAQKYAKSITELKAAITSFQTKDMSELLKFHKYVESQLEYLTDESQVLARFEGFPTKKLEALRMAAALHLKLDAILTNLVNWKIVAPLYQLLDKVESYFNKIKGELDALERTKDEESKKFQSNNIHFDFNILVKIKESMVDVSSGCMELALKEGREAKATANVQTSLKKGVRAIGSAKMLWKAFQFAFRVYTFAGGQDDRADNLARELAQEIENHQ